MTEAQLRTLVIALRVIVVINAAFFGYVLVETTMPIGVRVFAVVGLIGSVLTYAITLLAPYSEDESRRP